MTYRLLMQRFTHTYTHITSSERIGRRECADQISGTTSGPLRQALNRRRTASGVVAAAATVFPPPTDGSSTAGAAAGSVSGSVQWTARLQRPGQRRRPFGRSTTQNKRFFGEERH